MPQKKILELTMNFDLVSNSIGFDDWKSDQLFYKSSLTEMSALKKEKKLKLAKNMMQKNTEQKKRIRLSLIEVPQQCYQNQMKEMVSTIERKLKGQYLVEKKKNKINNLHKLGYKLGHKSQNNKSSSNFQKKQIKILLKPKPQQHKIKFTNLHTQFAQKICSAHQQNLNFISTPHKFYDEAQSCLSFESKTDTSSIPVKTDASSIAQQAINRLEDIQTTFSTSWVSSQEESLLAQNKDQSIDYFKFETQE